jgi:hypothetical protein
MGEVDAFYPGQQQAEQPSRRARGAAFFTEQRLLSLLEAPVPSATALLERLIARLEEPVAGANLPMT